MSAGGGVGAATLSQFIFGSWWAEEEEEGGKELVARTGLTRFLIKRGRSKEQKCT